MWGVWFATALAEPAAFFACPMHSPTPASVVHAPNSPTAALQLAASVPRAAEHHQHDARVVPAGHQQHSDAPAHSCCTCLGECCTMAPADLPRAAIAIPALTEHHPAAAAFAYTARLPQRADHALPFANGPPLTTLL